jgi:hypothetical protein
VDVLPADSHPDRDRCGKRHDSGRTTGADTLASLRLIRMGRAGVVMRVAGSCSSRAGMQQLHAASRDPGSEQQKEQRE